MKHFFFKGKNDLLASKTNTLEDKISIVKKDFSKVLESRNLSFLMGSGCSFGENGIPTMLRLAEIFFEGDKHIIEGMSDRLKSLILSHADMEVLENYGIKYSEPPFKTNLETFLGTLYSLRYYLEQTRKIDEIENIDKVINRTKHYILYQCLNIENRGKDQEVETTYKNFFRKLSLRDSNLPKPNIFTTNYDLYPEKTMDELGITYTNGFSGFIERYFNPSTFNYALAEQMDISSFKWSVIDSYIYLFKIHGSVNWIEVEESNKLFRIKELQNSSFEHLSNQKNLMIYPSPIKQNASLGTPYSDLFREFQKRIAQNQSALVTMGYSFADEHINNLIYQALTIPTFRLVIFSDLGSYKDRTFDISRTNIERLKNLNDPRVWIIGSDQEFSSDSSEEEINSEEDENQLPDSKDNIADLGEELSGPSDATVKKKVFKEVNPEKSLFHFTTISEDLLPDWSENIIEDNNQKIIQILNESSVKIDTLKDDKG